jgi:hypothetical protein
MGSKKNKHRQQQNHQPNRAERRASLRFERLTDNDEFFTELRKYVKNMDPDEQKMWEAEMRHILEVGNNLKREVKIEEGEELRFCIFAETLEELNKTVDWIAQQTPRLEDGQPFYMAGVDLISAKGSMVPGSLIDYNGTKVFYYDAMEFNQVQFHQSKMRNPYQLEERVQLAAAKIQERKLEVGMALQQRVQQIEMEKEIKQREKRPTFGLQPAKR